MHLSILNIMQGTLQRTPRNSLVFSTIVSIVERVMPKLDHHPKEEHCLQQTQTQSITLTYKQKLSGFFGVWFIF